MPLNIDKGQLGMSAQEKLQLLKKQLLEKANSDSAAYPLSYGQNALYFLYVNSPESPAYNVSFTTRILSPVNTEALKKALQKLVNRHPALRTNYRLEDGKPVQVVHGYQEVFFELKDVSHLDESGIRSEVLLKSKEPFDLEKGNVFRVYLFSRSSNDHVLLLNMHHISTDGRSIEIMLDEIPKLYEQATANSDSRLLPSNKYYHDFVTEQQQFVESSKGISQLDHWTNELSGELTDLDLPNDNPRPPMQTYNGSTVYFEIDKELGDKLKQASKESGSTIFAFMLACYMLFLRKHSDNEEVVTGIPAAGRSFAGYENVMGYFINPVAIRLNIPDEMAFEELLALTKRKVLYAIENQDVPFQLIVDKMMHGRDASRSPVFQTFFGMQKIQYDSSLQELIVPGNESARVEWAGLTLQPYYISQQEGQFDLTAEFTEGKEKFSGAFKFNSDLFKERTAVQMSEHFLRLLEQIADDKTKKVHEYDLITEQERELILNSWNNTGTELKGPDFIDRMFDNTAGSYPDNTALEFEGSKITYKELLRRSNAFCSHLARKNFGRGDLAAICLDRSFEMVVAMLAVLKAGGAYVPVDPDYPEDRIRFMLNDSGSKLMITQKVYQSFAGSEVAVVLVEDIDTSESETSTTFTSPERSLDDTAYVIYTSGSTGTPKGAAISHSSLANHMLWMKDIAGFGSSSSVLQKTPYSFDASVWEFYLPLQNGGRLVIAKPDGHMDTNYLAGLVRNSEVTHIQFVPSLLKLFIAEPASSECASLKFVFSGGEALTAELRDEVFKKLNARLINLYGPTEATIDSTYYDCPRNENGSSIPIGKPIYNMNAFVVDGRLKLLPPGIAGELLLGGAGIAKGYINNPLLTSEKFIEDHITNSGGKLYRTGDKVRFNSIGDLEYLGRIDHQVKFRGFRIELSEIESALKKHSSVRDAYVDLKKDKTGREVLAAYLICHQGDDTQIPDIRQSLKSFLPEYMVPGYYKVLEELPYLPNGKIDRKKLPAPEFQERQTEKSVKAKDPIEKVLVRIWCDVLGLDNIGVDDNFFELGGDSIMSIQIISRAAREGIRITPRQIFTYQTIAELSKVADAKDLVQVNEPPTGETKLTPVQIRFLEQKMQNPSLFNHSVLLRVRKGFNVEALDKALDAIIRQHDALRMKVVSSESGFIPDEMLPVAFAEFDFSEADNESAMRSLSLERERMNSLLDINKGRLINTALFRMPDESDRLLFNIHHICIDGVSWRIFLNDFVYSYESVLAGNEISFPDKSTSFREWSLKLHDCPVPDEAIKCFDFAGSYRSWGKGFIPEKPDLEENTFGSSAELTITLSSEETAQLTGEANKAYNTTINDLLLSALYIAYYRLTGDTGLLIDLEGHGRDELFEDADISNTVGWFTSIFPVLLKANHPGDFSSVIKSVKEGLKAVSPNGIFYGIMKYIRKIRQFQNDNEVETPVIVFNYLGQFRENIAPGGWIFGQDSLKLYAGAEEKKQHLIEMNSMIVSSGLTMTIGYSKRIFSETIIESFADNYLTALKEILKHCTNAGNVTYTASDFSDSGLNQQELDDLLTNLN